MRARLKHAVEHALVASGVTAISRAGRRGSVLILAYHDIVPDGAAVSGDRSLHLSRAAFAAQLDELARTHDVVSLADVLAGAGTRKRPAAVITFDDAYRGAVTYGVSELAARSMPATIFVAPAFVGGRSFWWDAIARPADPAADARFREYALTQLGGEDARVRSWAAANGFGERDVPAWSCCADESELARAAANRGLSFGAHSWSHPNLITSSPERLREELTAPLAWLRARFERVLDCVAYPYGLFSPAVAEAAASSGYRMALRVDGGWWRPPADDPMATPRVYVPAEISAAGFALRAAGMLAR